jgi:hypothetical protein
VCERKREKGMEGGRERGKEGERGEGETSCDQINPLTGGAISKHMKVLEKVKIWSRVSAGQETEIACAGEDH